MSDQEHTQPVSEPEQLLTFKEAMAYLRVSRSTLHRLLSNGQVPGHKVGGTWRFYASELQASVRNVSPSEEEGQKVIEESGTAVGAGTSTAAV